MQPVQYRGYAQGTAFNPVVLSDRSKKVLEQNEQYLRVLQETQKIERNVKIAKLKQLQENIESQRQQLNENFNYDQRQRERVNQSLEANAAREVEQLKKVVALEDKHSKPSSAAYVNEVANFFLGLSETAGKVISEVRTFRTEGDKAAAQQLYDSLSKQGRESYLKGELISELNQNVFDLREKTGEAEMATHSIDGRPLQESLVADSLRPGVKAQFALINAEQNLKNYTFKYNASLNPDDLLLPIEEQVANFQKGLAKEIDPLRELGINDEQLAPLLKRAADEESSFIGSLKKLQTNQLKSELVKKNQEKLFLDPTPTNFHNFLQSVHLYNNGDKVKGWADFKRVVTDPRIPDPKVEEFLNTPLPDQLKPIFLRSDESIDELKAERARRKNESDNSYQQLKEEKDLQIEGELFRKQDEFLSDDGQITNTEAREEELASTARDLERRGYPKAAAAARQMIRSHQSVLHREQQERDLQVLADNYGLTMEAINKSGVRGERRKHWISVYDEQRADYKPNEYDKSFINTVSGNAISQRESAGAGFGTSTRLRTVESGIAQDVFNGLLTTVFQDAMYKSGGDRGFARKEVGAAAMTLLGDDPTKGLFSVSGDIATIQANAAKGIPATFNNPLIIPSANKIYEQGGNARRAIVDQVRQYQTANPGVPPENVLKDIVTEQRLGNTVRLYNTTGIPRRDPGLEIAANTLGITYPEAHNLAAKLYGREDLLLPNEITEPVKQATTILNNTEFGKFSRTLGLDQGVIGKGVKAHISGGEQPWNPTVNPNNASPAAAKLTISYENTTNPVGKALVEMAQRNGWDPLDIAMIFSFETKGTLNINTPGEGAAEGRIGWIQAGQWERDTYGLGSGDPMKEIIAVEKYLIDRSAKPGHGLADLYSAVNNGQAYLGYNPDGNGVVPRDKDTLDRIREHRAKAIEFFGFN